MGEFRRYWLVLLISALAMALGSALNHYASNLFGPALLHEFGWKKADLSLTGTLGLFGMIFVPLWGRFVDSYGARIAAIIGFSVVALCYLAYTQMTGDIRVYFAITTVHNIFGILTTTIVFARVVVERFTLARGMALSILMSGAPLAAAIFMPILHNIIQNDGWRAGYELLALLTIGAGILAVICVGPHRAKPQDSDQKPRVTWSIFKQYASKPVFLLLVGGMFLVNIPQILVAGMLNIMLMENGATPWLLAKAVTIYSSAVVVGRIITGLVLDRIPAHIVAIFALGLPAIGYVILATPYDPLGLVIAAIALVGLAQGAEGDLGAYIASHKFGVEDFSFIYSFLIVSMGIANAVGAGILSISLRLTNRFDGFLLICALATIAGTYAFYRTGKIESVPNS